MSSPHTPIDYAGLAAALLQRADRLLPEWLPGGRFHGAEYVCADLGGGAGRSLSVNINTGAWADFSGEDRGGDLTSLYAAINGLDNGRAALQLMEMLGWRHETAPDAARTRPVQTPARGQQRPEPPADEAGDDAPKGRRKSLWRAIVPVPDTAPPPDFKHWHYSEVEASWEYRFESVLYGHIVRFRTSDGGKEIMPHTWCVDESDGRGTMRWHWKQWDEPRPLYVPATLLSLAPGTIPVVLVEGEKCALAGHKLLGHEFDFVSWPGGSKAWAKAAWAWLQGRTVYLWPDADSKRERLLPAERKAGTDPESKPLLPEHKQPGMACMVAIGTLLMADHACTVHLCPVPKPGNVGDGWDIADAIEQGWDAEQVRAFIRGAHAFVPPNDEARAKAQSTPAMAGADPDDVATGWRHKLLSTDKGAIKACRENVVLALDGMVLPGRDGKADGWLPGIPEAAGVIAFNDFTNNVVKLCDAPGGTPAGVWDESDELELGNWLSRTHWLPPMSRQTLEEAVTMVARRHRYHPARERFEALRGAWDEQRRLHTWLARMCRAEGVLPDDDPLQRYLARVGTWMVMAMVARVLRPGCKHDYMMILEGKQGAGKSTVAQILGGEWFADTGLILGDKDSYQNLQGILVYEWGELDSLTRSEVTKVKQFISSQKDRFRASFDKRPKDYPRQVVFIGTTNEHHYLSDPTGNRRFWPVRVTRVIDTAALRAELDQLLAEAIHYVDAGERFHPTHREQIELFDPQQGERTVENALEAGIRRYLYDEDQRIGMNGLNGSLISEVALNDLLSALGISLDKQTQVLTKQASAALGRMGWERARASGRGGVARPWVYRRPVTQYVADAGKSGDGNPINGRTHGHQPEGAEDDCPL